MIVGHYAAALLPRAHQARGPFWLLLLSANIPEFLWLALALFGVESPEPASLFQATFANLKVSMHWSHNLLPGAVQAVLVGAAVRLIWRDLGLALWCAGLVLLHILCDFLVGFEHQVLSPQSPVVSLNLYATAPYAAIGIELLFSLICLVYYDRTRAMRGSPLPRGRRVALYAVFVLGILAWLPAARTPLADILARF